LTTKQVITLRSLRTLQLF